MHRTRRLLAVLACGALLAGCTGGPPPRAGKEILVLGVVAAGNQKDPNLAGAIKGVELAVRQYNSNPDSGYRIDLKQLGARPAAGEAGSTSGDLTRTERLIGVIGPFTDKQVVDLGPLFEGAGMSFLVPQLSGSAVAQPGGTSFRRLIANDSREGALLADQAMRQVTGSIVMVVEASDPGNAFAGGAKRRLEDAKRPAARTESVEPGKGLGSLATSLVQGNPQAILFGGGGQTGTALLEALRKANFKGAFVASHQLRDANPRGLGAGVTSSSLGADPADPGAAGFVRDFKDRFGAGPTPFALESYEGAIMLFDAVEEVAGKPRDVTEFLRQNRRFLGDSKSYEFDDAGELPKAPIWIYQSDNGSWKLTGRSDRLAAGR